MKAKMSYKSKKIAIITAIILVLIGGISIGTYFYIRGNTDAEATTGNNTTINNGIIDEQGDDSENNNQIINETSDETNTTENGSTNESNSSTDENSSSNESNSGSSGESGNDSTGGTTNGSSSNGGNNANQNDDADVPNEEYTQIDYIETGNQILVSEGLAVGWINADLSKDNVSTKIDVVKPSLELNKTAEIGSINETDNSVQTGSKITYNITVTNTSSDADAKNVTVTDMVPEGTVLDEETPISNDGTIENGKITWNVDVPKNSSVTVSFTVVVTAESGEIRNAAVVDGKDTPETENPVIEADKIATSEDEIVTEGSEITYTITVTNKSNVNAITSVKDEVPEGTTLVDGSVTGEADIADNTITWNDVELEAGETKTFTFKVTVNSFEGEGITIRNVALVGGGETPGTETEVHNPVISYEKTADKTAVQSGEVITYTIKATNTGIVPGTIKVKDTIPENTTFVDGSIVVAGVANSELTAEDLANGIDLTVPAKTTGEAGDVAGEATITFQVTVNENVSGVISNTAYVDDEPTEEVKNPIININKIADKTEVEAGDTITYTITLANTGDVAGKAIVADTIPEGTTFVTNSIKVNGAVTEYTVDDLAKGIEVEVPAKVGDVAGETTVSFDVTVGDLNNGDTIRNVATVNGEDTPETETEYQEPIITSEKTSNKSAVVVGEEIEYTITAYNNGYADGKAVVKDTIPTGTSFVEGSIVVDGVANSELTAEDLANGIEVNVEAATKGAEGEADIAGEATVTFKVVVEEGAEGSIINKATVNDTPTEEIKNPVISATKTATANGTTAVTGTEVEAGDTITYTITVTNTGDIAGKATVADTIPEGTTFVGGSIVIDGASRADLTEEDLENGISVQVTTLKPITISFKVTVNDLTDGDTIRNVATVNGEDTPETETKYQEPVISQSKSADKTVVVAGETITYTITATNTGSLAGNAIIRDTIPTNTTFVVNSIKVNGEATEYTAENLANGIEVSVPAKSGEVAGETTVTFQVTVNSGATGTISNKAYVNDNPTEEVETPVITANKQASETRVEVGDTITYTITLRNNSNVDGKVTVKDSNPENTTFVEGSIAINDVKDSTKTLENLTNGIEIEVPAKGTATVSFDVTVNEGTTVGTDIKNTASVNDVPTNETTTTVVEPTLEISKSAATILDTDDNGIEIPGQSKDEAEIGDIIVYTITVKNTSDLEADVNVTDTLPTEVDFVNGSIKVENGNSSNVSYNPDTRTISYNGTLAGNTTLTITFRAKVNTTAEVGKPILNIAYVNDKPTNETTTTVVKKVTVTTTAQTMNSLDLVLVLDVSGSMGTSGEINNLKTAAENLVNRVFSSETNSTISLITYSDTAKIVGTYEYNDKATLVGNPDGYYWERNGIIDNLTTGGGTNIYDALDKANTKIEQLLRMPNAENRKRVVVFLTDGSPTFYYENEGSNWNPDYPTGDIVNVNAVTDSTYKNNLRPNILEQASELKTKSNTTVYAVGLGINDLKDDENHIQYAEKYTQGLDTSIFNGYENKGDRWNPTRYYYMYEKTYAKYILNNISSSGSYMETSDLDTTFDDILSSQTTNKYSYEATTMPVTITIPETRTIIDDEVTVQIGDNGREITYTLRQLSGNGVNGLTYTEGVGFTWVINSDDILDENLYISYKVEGVAEDNQ